MCEMENVLFAMGYALIYLLKESFEFSYYLFNMVQVSYACFDLIIKNKAKIIFAHGAII